jgi:hypothetical protein
MTERKGILVRSGRLIRNCPHRILKSRSKLVREESTPAWVKLVVGG